MDLTVADVNSWYQSEEGEQGEEPVSLISADGIHPNARCYSRWGAFVGNSLADQIMSEQKQENHILPIQKYHHPAFAGGFQATTPAFGSPVRQQKQDQ